MKTMMMKRMQMCCCCCSGKQMMRNDKEKRDQHIINKYKERLEMSLLLMQMLHILLVRVSRHGYLSLLYMLEKFVQMKLYSLH